MKLSGTQQAALAQLKLRHDHYREQLREEEARHNYQVTQLREPVQSGVAEARELGIPEAQIYKTALGMADYRTLERFMGQTNTVPAPKSGEPIIVPVVETDRKPRVVKIHPQTWEVYGTDGELWKRINLGNADQVWVASFDEEVPDEIREALIEATGRKPIIASIRIGDEPIREEQWGEFV